MKFEITGIKCDNKKCSFEDSTVKKEDYKAWLNKPCPNCGDNLLTQKDFDTVEKMIKLEKTLNNSKIYKTIEKVLKFFGDKEVVKKVK